MRPLALHRRKSTMKTSLKEYVEEVYKGGISCEGVTRLHQMESEYSKWIDEQEAGIVASMEESFKNGN